MRRFQLLLAALLVLLWAVPALALPTVYEGSLSTEDGTLQGTGVWTDPGISAFAWRITQIDTNLWNYRYTLDVPRGHVQRIVVEVPQYFEEEYALDTSVNPDDIEFGWYDGQGNSDPGLPEAFYGMQFFIRNPDTRIRFDFDSPCAPAWGDFYARGPATGGERNSVWNGGFTTSDSDPTSDPGSGSQGNHILTPSTTVVPEPGTLAMLAFGAGSVWLRRRKR